MAKGPTLEPPAGAIPLSEYLQQTPGWKTYLAAKAECDRLMQPVIVGSLPSDEQRLALARAEAERDAANAAARAEVYANHRAKKIRVFGRLGPLDPLSEIPSDARMIFTFATSTARDTVTGTVLFNVCVVPSPGPASHGVAKGGRRETQVERALNFLKEKWPPFGVPPNDISVETVRGMLDEHLKSDNKNRGLRTPAWDSVKRAIKRAKKAEADGR
jgi:hypothetical protein